MTADIDPNTADWIVTLTIGDVASVRTTHEDAAPQRIPNIEAMIAAGTQRHSLIRRDDPLRQIRQKRTQLLPDGGYRSTKACATETSL